MHLLVAYTSIRQIVTIIAPIAGVPPVCCSYGYSQIFLKNVKIISFKFLLI